MPPKLKLQKSTGKLASLPKGNSNNELQMPALTQEQQQQFEVELCWCIQQLQNALKSGKLTEKQVQDHSKSLNALMSNATSLIKKRQVMRLSFGDYRAKMAAEDKKLKGQTAKIKCSMASPSTKSTFIKKSAFLNNTGNNFRFNFNTPADDVTADISNLNLEPSNETQTQQNSVNEVPNNLFVKSDNSFRFNFACDN